MNHNINNHIKSRLVGHLLKHRNSIVSKWSCEIMKVSGHKKHKVIVPIAKHKKGMSRFFNFFILFLKNQHDARALKFIAYLIQNGYLSINSAEDIIHGQMLLRRIIRDALISGYKSNASELYKMLDLLTTAFDSIILHISNVYRKRDFWRLHMLVKSGKRLVGTRDLNKLLVLTIKTAIKESNADRASIMLLDKDGILKINTSRGIPDTIVQKTQERLGKGIAGVVAKTNKPIIINEGDKIPGSVKKYLKGLKIVSAVSIPLSIDSEVLGVLNLGKYHGKTLFDTEDTELLDILAYEAATSIKSYQLMLEAEGLYIGTIFALAAALDARDHYTHGHSRKVAKYAVIIAKEMKLPKYQIDIVRRASLLHDIGKIGIPDRILNKPARLTDQEFKIVKKHPRVAFNILKPIPQAKDLLPAIYHEHERYDGKGYIVGLRGEAIPLEARIIGVADAFDAMTSERPYRRALSEREATMELVKCSGTQFDPVVVKTFLRTLKK
ncbi:MAG: HD domain-containing protein [Candidatus Omnitrophica bacterium]|nr:HD domain-containing protein [Candidatus Omnitrophota bacterium]